MKNSDVISLVLDNGGSLPLPALASLMSRVFYVQYTPRRVKPILPAKAREVTRSLIRIEKPRSTRLLYYHNSKHFEPPSHSVQSIKEIFQHFHYHSKHSDLKPCCPLGLVRLQCIETSEPALVVAFCWCEFRSFEKQRMFRLREESIDNLKSIQLLECQTLLS